MKILWLILLVEPCIIQSVLASNGDRFTNVKNNKKIANDDGKYVNLKGLSEVQCVGHCTLTDECHSVNYDDDDQICLVIDELFEGDGDSHLIDARGWKYFKKTRLKNQVLYNITNPFVPDFTQNRPQLVNYTKLHPH